jgi:hypothetical protein
LQAPPAVSTDQSIEQSDKWGGGASKTVRSQAEPRNEMLVSLCRISISEIDIMISPILE